MPFCERCGAMMGPGQACANPKCGKAVVSISQSPEVTLEQAVEAHANNKHMQRSLASIARKSKRNLNDIAAEFAEIISGKSPGFVDITSITSHKYWHKIPLVAGSTAVSRAPLHVVLMHAAYFIECIEKRPPRSLGYFVINSGVGEVLCPDALCMQSACKVHYGAFRGLGELYAYKNSYTTLVKEGRVVQSAFEKYIIHVPEEITKLSSRAKY